MTAKPVKCRKCGSDYHYQSFCPLNRKPLPRSTKAIKATKKPRKLSAKEIDYQEWKENVARPFLIERDGNKCNCCGRPAYDGEKLDIDHIKNKGSHPEHKRNLDLMQLLCRLPCHRNKTDNKSCPHP